MKLTSYHLFADGEQSCLTVATASDESGDLWISADALDDLFSRVEPGGFVKLYRFSHDFTYGGPDDK